MRNHRIVAILVATLVFPAMLFAGSISGKVTYTGTPVKPKPIDMSKEPSCAKQHATPVTTETIVTGELKIVNADQTSHNIHPLAKVNREWNKSQPPGTPPIMEKYDKPEFISVKCNIHPWMHGEFAVLNTNHFDVSKDGGAFKLPNLPPGKYTITAWQEDYGTQTADVTITGNETKEVNFTFKAKAY